MIKVLHTADWHIGCFPGPEKDGKNMRLNDIVAAIDSMIHEAETMKPDIVLVSGDIFHQAKVWSDRGLSENQIAAKLIAKFSKIAPVIVMRGTPNHDSDEQFKTLQTRFENTDVHIINEPELNTYTLRNGKQIQVACVPGFDRGYYRSLYPGIDKEDENRLFTKSIADLINDFSNHLDTSIPSVLMTHFTVPGSDIKGGQTTFFEKIEPVVTTDTLSNTKFTIHCLGHVHKPQQICPHAIDNAFYSGSVCQLNFNDEGQKHGFYIHEIDETDCSIRSEFIELNTRQFMTVEMGQYEIEQFNENGEAALGYIKNISGKIIRVLYTCDDEENKKFNKSKLEKWFYKNNAFFVQEITPQDITATQTKKIMSNSNPEDNLTDYLIEKNFNAQQIADVIDLARPIIDESCTTNTQVSSGVFVPVSIEVQNYRNYRNEFFSFDPIQCCTINGNNGVGKSSLFMDAIIDALFEETREGELTGWITNDPSVKSGSIKFVFDIGTKRYRVTRTRTKSGKATLNISEFVNGGWENRSKEKQRDTQAEIKNIIGIDSLTLKACALIMQDQYGLFLQADKEARMTVLGNILGLNAYQTMEKIAAEKATETNREVRHIKENLDSLSAGMPDIDELNRQLAAALTNKTTLDNNIQTKTDTMNSLKMVISAQADIDQRISKLNQRRTSVTTQMMNKLSTEQTQKVIIGEADTVLSQESEIKKNVALYYSLLDEEKTIIAKLAEYDKLAMQKTMLQNTLDRLTREASALEADKSSLEAKITAMKAELSKEDDLIKAKTAYDELNTQLTKLNSKMCDYETTQKTISDIKDTIAKIDRMYSEKSTSLNATLESLIQKTELLKNSNCPHAESATCTFLADAIEAKSKIPAIENDIRTNKEQYESARKDLSARLTEAMKVFETIQNIPSEIIRVQKEMKSLEYANSQLIVLANTKTQLSETESSLRNCLTLIETNKVSQTDTVKQMTDLDKNIELLMPYMAKQSDIKTRIDEAKMWLDKEKELLTASSKKLAALSLMSTIQTELEDINKELKEIDEDIKAETSKRIDITSVNTNIQTLTAEIAAAKTAYNNCLTEISELQTSLKDSQDKKATIDRLTKELADMSKKAAIYEELKKDFSQSGIPHNIIRSIIPSLESTASNILSQMSGGNMNVEFVTEKQLKSNSKKEVITLDIIINDSNTGRLPYMSRSGGERVKAALSVILALAEIKSKTAGIQLGFLFIDEPPFLDGPGVQAYCDALETIQKRYNSLKIMAITHDPSMKNRFPQSVDIVKTAAGSKVV